MLKTFTLTAITIGSISATNAEPESDFHESDVIETIAFGSCNDPRKGDSPMFHAISEYNPDLFIFLGDNIYGDTDDMELLAKKWDELGAVGDYQTLRENTTVLATWDDHDYGINDGGLV